MGRIWLLAVIAAGIWFLTVYGQYRPAALGLDAPATQFSAARADAVLDRLLEAQQPHPAGSQEAARVRARLLKELDALGVHARTVTEMSCFSEARWSILPCGSVTNIIANVSPGSGKGILLTAHTDSVAAGPGAADDGSGVATLLETIRALKARHLAGGHPVTALFTDGEENGMVGAAAYLRDPRARAATGAVINVEARGNQGPSYLFQTSPGDGRLIDLYAASVPHVATSSLYAEIYKYLPNDTDLTVFLLNGIAGYNFAFIGNVAQYHTPLDRRENIDPRSLQQHGENALELADTLSRTDLARLKGRDAIYLDVLGFWLPRLPQSWALPMSLIAFAGIALAGFLTRGRGRMWPGSALAALMPVLLLAGCVGTGFGLTFIAAQISGHTDPSFAHPMYMRLALGFGVWTVALLTSRWAGAIASWLWLAGLAIACALFLPGVTPYFLFPCLVGAPLLLVTAWGGREIALLVGALAALAIWIGLTAAGEAIMGLRLHVLFTATAAFGLVALLPLLGKARDAAWAVSMAVSLLIALVMAVTAGLQPAFSNAAPERMNIRYVEYQGKAAWLADPVERLSPDLRAAVDFSAKPERFLERGYVAFAGAPKFPAPSAIVARSGNDVTLELNAPGDGVALVVPEKAKLTSLTVGGVTVSAPEREVFVMCGTPDCGQAHITLRLASSAPVTLTLISQRRGLPPEGERLLNARPSNVVPSQSGDVTWLAAKIDVPGG
ncbi:MAG TPA: M20/M25/M40 family metallo-hydrolase [Rhizomicrobium sp.]